MPALFSKILIANRGEIACRIIKTARRLAISTVGVYSDADREALHVALADEALRIGPAPARESYLEGVKIIAAALAAGAEAVHPGYGFLAENAAFAEACAEAGLVFIGPPPDAIRAMGDKAEAKALMERASVPLLPGYHGPDQGLRRLGEAADAIGYPVMIKPSAGGGGKGMKIVAEAAAFAAAVESARREAASAFGDDRLLVEKFLPAPRHVEVQIFADARQNYVHLFDRDCSIQRRHQKIIEEAPAPGLSDDLRRHMREAALAAAKAISYVGAGTIEFLVPASLDAFYFMEMNTRLQVEHPATEMIAGLDLVEWQIRIAAGEALPLEQAQILSHGHAIEARLYAEDPMRDFLPQPGRIERLDLPTPSPQLRIDAGVAAPGEVPIYYDPLIAKLIVWGADRPAAIRRLRAALDDVFIEGVATNIELLRRIAGHQAYADAALDTGFIARHSADLLAPPGPPSREILAMAAVGLLCWREEAARAQAKRSRDQWSPWSSRDGWLLNGRLRETLRLREIDAAPRDEIAIGVAYLRRGWRLDLPQDGMVLYARGALAPDGALCVDLDGHQRSASWTGCPAGFAVFRKGEAVRHFALIDGTGEEASKPQARGRLVSPMPGRIAALLVEPGARVEANQPILVLEAMKMEHQLRAPGDGLITEFYVRAGDQAAEGAELARFEGAGHVDETER
ncbi:acetyl/propionyl/methylcrotonyl-CoA carboxylase subunit alpha [Methylocapsa acidiphila]|uniref:acetyl/propionyl/methylcrotonyl-CoA carboxylase subunit alpha n=1 Tax=Methylocapsa acidiphila TaxID=133552 RepID=UPI000569943F|nr:biotin carboxylase N-terminal domain-containing protein [Methylocapsa acidiphila]